jgi:SAM-dependent methyltransferase
MHMESSALQADSELGAFPAPLVCPVCGEGATSSSVCAGTGQPCMSVHFGIPRFLFGQEYWGETSSGKMRQLLAGAQSVPWRTALQRHAGDEPISQHLLSPIRADFLHAMPWDRIRTVLDVGAGMGFMSCDMALYAESVVALEAVPERAEFIQIRARQDNLKVFPIIASAMAMPFPTESFDLITLNGVFEYIGLWGDGDPKKLQENFLGSALKLLRPGGYLYVGIETRYAASAFLGHRDHSGLAFTSLMPRPLANLYCRLKASPFYGAEHIVRGYRTYTHTPLQYRKMFYRTGYRQVSVQGVFDGYNRQRALYDIDDHAARKAVLSRIDPAASARGTMRRLLTGNRLTYRTLENEVVIFAQKEPMAGCETSMPWAEIVTPGQTVVQVNLPFKILGILCDRGVPVEVLEVEKRGHEDAGRRLERAFEALRTLQQELESELLSLPMRWPAPKGTIRVAGRAYRRYEHIPGQSLSTWLLPNHYDDRVVPQLVSRAVAAYVSLCNQLTICLHGRGREPNWKSIEEELALVEMSHDIRQDCNLALDAARNAGWKLSAVHGDFTPGNLLITPSGELVLIDWEHFTPAYPIGADLIRFLQDTFIESSRLTIGVRGRFHQHLRQVVDGALQSCGYAAKDYRHLYALYIAQQIAALGGESRAYPPLLKEYRVGRRLLDDDQCNA